MNDVAAIARLLGEPARATMVECLMDGTERLSGELGRYARIAAAAASEHLGRLVAAGLLATRTQGRHRYYRIAREDVAHAIETLAALSPAPRVRSLSHGNLLAQQRAPRASATVTSPASWGSRSTTRSSPARGSRSATTAITRSPARAVAASPQPASRSTDFRTDARSCARVSTSPNAGRTSAGARRARSPHARATPDGSSTAAYRARSVSPPRAEKRSSRRSACGPLRGAGAPMRNKERMKTRSGEAKQAKTARKALLHDRLTKEAQDASARIRRRFDAEREALARRYGVVVNFSGEAESAAKDPITVSRRVAQ